MKAISFGFMSYQDLPDDFAKNEESIWVNFDSRLMDSKRMHYLYNRYLDELEFAESVGFDGVGVNEHHATGYGPDPSPNLLAASLARRTSNAALVVLGTSLALYNPPVRVAEEYAMLDTLSGGRVIAGFPVGTPMDGPYAYSINPSELRSRYKEAHDLIIKAWASDEPFEWNGDFHQMRYVNAVPKPIQRPHPPVWVPGAGSVNTWDFCALNGYVYCYLSYFGMQTGSEVVAGYWNRLRELGVAPNPYRLALTQFVALADSRDEAIDLYSGAGDYFYGNCLHVSPRFMGPPGYLGEDTIRAVARRQAPGGKVQSSSLSSDYQAHDFKYMLDNGWIMAGSPTEVAEQLADVCIKSNIGNVLVLTSFGRMAPELARYNTEMFATEVLPELRGLHSDWEHEWWPRPLGQPALPAPLAPVKDAVRT